jgi:hypothetical protein
MDPEVQMALREMLNLAVELKPTDPELADDLFWIAAVVRDPGRAAALVAEDAHQKALSSTMETSPISQSPPKKPFVCPF